MARSGQCPRRSLTALERYIRRSDPRDAADSPGRRLDGHDPVDPSTGECSLVATTEHVQSPIATHHLAPHLFPETDQRPGHLVSACPRRSRRRPGAGWPGTGTCPSGPCRSWRWPPTSSRSRSTQDPTAGATGCSSGSGRGRSPPWSGSPRERRPSGHRHVDRRRWPRTPASA